MALAAGITAGGSLLSGIFGGKGASKAAKQQAQAYQQGLAQQQRQFDITQANFAPYLASGAQALGGVEDLLGLNGGTVQSGAIDALKASPAYTSLYDTGVDTILQNAAATGGLRGGNVQYGSGGLAQFGSGLLAQVIQQQLGNLGGLVNAGQGSAATLGGISQNNANAQSNLYGQLGGAKATAAAAPYSAAVSTLNGLNQGFGLNSGFRW